MTQAHIDGILAMLRGADLIAYDTEAEESPTFPYVVVVSPSLMRVSKTLSGVPRDFHDYLYVVAVGTGVSQARWIQERAYLALDRKSPQVAGYATDIRRTATGAMGPDREVTLPGSGHPIYATDSYLYRATPSGH